MMHTEIFYLFGYLVLPSFLLKGALSRTTAVGTRAPTKVGDVIKWFLFKKKRCRFSLLLLSCLVSYWEDFLGFLFFPIAIREFSSRNQKNDNIVNLWDLDHRIIIPLKKKNFPDLLHTKSLVYVEKIRNNHQCRCENVFMKKNQHEVLEIPRCGIETTAVVITKKLGKEFSLECDPFPRFLL